MCHKEVAIFTGGDSKYFELINDLIVSIRKQNNDINMIIIDSGLKAEQIKILKNNNNIQIINAEKMLINDNIERKSIISILRLRLKEICDTYSLNYKILIWLDADAWVQNLEILLKNCANIANKKKLAIVSQNSRNSERSLYTEKIIELGTWSLFRLRNIVYKNSKGLGLSNNMLRKLEAKPTLNSGVFALHIDSPHWEKMRFWQQYIIDNGGKQFNSDQLSIGYTIYLDNYDYELLPDTCNYLCGCYKLRYNENTKKFVEYHSPYDEISVMHFCGLTKFTKDWEIREIYNMSDEKTMKSILYAKQ